MAGFDINSDLLCNTSNNPYKLKNPLYKVVDESDFVEPVTIQELKEFAGIDYASDDLLLAQILKSARIQSESYLQRSLGIRTVRFRALECPEYYYLSWGLIDDATVVGDYTLFGDQLVEGGKDIDITYTSTDELVNDETKQGILILGLQLYDKRERFLSRVRETGAQIDLWKEKLNPYRKIQYP
jgi:hypothetical protein